MEQKRPRRRRHSLDRFYAGDSKSQPGTRASVVSETEAAATAVRLRLLDALRKQPDDVSLLLRSNDALLRTIETQYRVAGGDKERLRQNFQAVLDSLGNQLLPPDD